MDHIRSRDMVSRLGPLLLSAFAIGVDGAVVVGLVPDVSRSLGTSVRSAGEALGLFPLSFALVGPVVAARFAGHSRRRVCLYGMLTFALGNVLAGLASNLLLFGLARAIAGVGAAAVIPLLTTTAAESFALASAGRAVSVVASGFTLGTVAGAPVGLGLARVSGWRPVLVAVGLLGALAGACQTRVTSDSRTNQSDLKDRFSKLGDFGLLRTLVLTATMVTGEFTVYTYMTQVVRRASDGASWLLPVAFLVFGAATWVGSIGGGVAVDRRGWRTVVVVAVTLVGLSLLALPLAEDPWILLGLLLAWGMFGWSFTPAQVNRLVRTFPESRPEVLALNSSAVYLGIAAGSVIGGLALGAGGVPGLERVGAVVVLLSLLFVPAHAGKGPRRRRAHTSVSGTPSPNYDASHLEST